MNEPIVEVTRTNVDALLSVLFLEKMDAVIPEKS
jgi:hypothetical protein